MQKFQRALRIFVLLNAIILLTTILLAGALYPEPYLAFNEFLSRLGANYSYSNLENGISKKIFQGGLMISSFISLMIAIVYIYFSINERKKRITHILQAFFSLAISFGAIGISIPADSLDPTLQMFHILGATVFFACYSILNCLWQIRRPKHNTGDPVDTIIDTVWAVFIIISGVAYAILYVLYKNLLITGNFPHVLQKLVVVEIIISAFTLDVEDL